MDDCPGFSRGCEARVKEIKFKSKSCAPHQAIKATIIKKSHAVMTAQAASRVGLRPLVC